MTAETKKMLNGRFDLFYKISVTLLIPWMVWVSYLAVVTDSNRWTSQDQAEFVETNAKQHQELWSAVSKKIDTKDVPPPNVTNDLAIIKATQVDIIREIARVQATLDLHLSAHPTN